MVDSAKTSLHCFRNSRRKAGILPLTGRSTSGVLLVFTFLSIVSRGFSQGHVNRVPFRDALIRKELFPPASHRTDRYVSLSGSDANDGTKQHPWASISHAGSVATPGTIVHVAPGVYIEAVTTAASGSADARILYISDKPWAAVIATPGRDGFAWRDTGNYTDVIGFEVAGTRCGGIGLGGSFQKAISSHVHNSASGCTTSDGGSGINDFNYTSQENEILNNYVHDVGITEPSCGQPNHNVIHGIYQANAGGRVDHNVSVNNCGFGIHLWHAATRATITNNTVLNNKAGGIVIGSGDAPCTTTGCPGGNDSTRVMNNIVAFNGNPVSGGWGIGEASQDPGQIGPHNSYSHNLGFQNGSGDFYLPRTKDCESCITGRDPRFVSASAGDFRLKADSPALGAGKPVEAVSIKPVDLGALPRTKN